MNAIVQKAWISNSHPVHDGALSRTESRPNPAGEIVHLEGSQYMALHDALGWTVQVFSGSVWITQDGDIRDIVLEAGESIMLDRDGLALFSPFGSASFRLTRNSGRNATRRSPLKTVTSVTLSTARVSMA